MPPYLLFYAYFCLNTMMATSGHISAHNAQPLHFPESEKTATVKPWLLGVSLRDTSFWAQAMVQSPHPLQRVSSMMIFVHDIGAFLCVWLEFIKISDLLFMSQVSYTMMTDELKSGQEVFFYGFFN